MSIFKFTLQNSLLLLAICTLFVSCKDDDMDAYSIPDTYSFDNVDFSGQTTRMDMLEEMTALMKTGNTPGTQVDAQALKDMYNNQNSPFSDPTLNAATTKQLKDKCFSLDADLFEGYMDSLEAASMSSVAGSNGVAGVVTSPNDPATQYLFSATGKEYTQLIEKGLMGAVFYYQITEVYLGQDKIGPGVDNTTITPGEGTALEHHWDEAFGYFGVPTDFPSTTNGIRFIGKYCDGRDDLLGTNAVMTAYLAGRAAISNDDMDTKAEQIPLIRDYLEEVFAGTALHYINAAKAAIADDAVRNHSLSEAIAFISGLKYNPTARISASQITSVLNHIGDNLYEVSITGLNAARDELSSIYGFDAIKDQL